MDDLVFGTWPISGPRPVLGMKDIPYLIHTKVCSIAFQ